jgi:hypothetical protein
MRVVQMKSVSNGCGHVAVWVINQRLTSSHATELADGANRTVLIGTIFINSLYCFTQNNPGLTFIWRTFINQMMILNSNLHYLTCK